MTDWSFASVNNGFLNPSIDPSNQSTSLWNPWISFWISFHRSTVFCSDWSVIWIEWLVFWINWWSFCIARSVFGIDPLVFWIDWSVSALINRYFELISQSSVDRLIFFIGRSVFCIDQSVFRIDHCSVFGIDRSVFCIDWLVFCIDQLGPSQSHSPAYIPICGD